MAKSYSQLTDDALAREYERYRKKSKRNPQYNTHLQSIRDVMSDRGIEPKVGPSHDSFFDDGNDGITADSTETTENAAGSDTSGWDDLSVTELQKRRDGWQRSAQEYPRGGASTVVENIDAELERREQFSVAELSVATDSGNAPHPGKPTIVSGIAIGHRDSTLGSSGVPKLWDSDALRPAVSTLEGKPIVANHTEDDVREVVGQITKAEWDSFEGGLAYEGEIDDPKIAQQVERGRLEVSVTVQHKPVDDLKENSKGEKLLRNAGDVKEFKSLSVVTHGASPSNSIETGALRSN